MASRGMSEFTHGGIDYAINDQNIADEFSEEVNYKAGDHFTYAGGLYVFNVDHPAGAMVSGEQMPVQVGKSLKEKKSDIYRLEKGNAKKPGGIIGGNLFDKTGEYTKIFKDKYRNYENGRWGDVQGFEVAYFYVKAGEKYVINTNNVHVCFFSDDVFSNFVSGFLVNATNGYTFTVPSTAVTMSLSFAYGAESTFMLQHGVLSTPFYIPFEIGTDGKNIMDNPCVIGVMGKNLFDKTGKYTDVVQGYYRDYRRGDWGTSSSFEVITIKTEAGVSYAVSATNVHVCFYSDEYATEYMSGILIETESDRVFTTLQIEKSTTVTTYEAFKFGILSKDIVDGGIAIHVGAGRAYTTIQSAVNDASYGDIIFIDPGVYQEAVDMVGKQLHLIGAGPHATIIQYAGDDYYYPPLEASKGLIENIGFITTATEPAEGAISQSYCVHIDYDSEANSYLQFKNCYFKSPNKHTVGIGLRENFTLNFTDCEFIAAAPPVYCHEQQASNKTGQRIELVNCSIYNTLAQAAILLQETPAYTGNEMTILMQRCIAKANGLSGDSIISAQTYPDHTPPTGSNYLNCNGWYLSELSAMNNENILNA